MDKKNLNTLWSDAIAKEMVELERLGVLQLYPHKTKYEKKYGYKYAPMQMIFDVKHKYLRHKSRLVVGGHFVDSTDHTTYYYTIKDVSMRLIILISVKNGLGIMARDIGNLLCASPCA